MSLILLVESLKYDMINNFFFIVAWILFLVFIFGSRLRPIYHRIHNQFHDSYLELRSYFRLEEMSERSWRRCLQWSFIVWLHYTLITWLGSQMNSLWTSVERDHQVGWSQLHERWREAIFYRLRLRSKPSATIQSLHWSILINNSARNAS